MNWSQFNPLKRVENYTIFLHHLGLFSEQDKNEILKKSCILIKDNLINKRQTQE